MRVDTIYVNVWTAIPSIEQLRLIADAERTMPTGYRCLEIIERLDTLTFGPGLRALLQETAREFVGRPAKNIIVLRAEGFASVVIHGLAGILNAVGLASPVHTDLELALVELLRGTSSPAAAALRPLIDAQIARHIARVPRP